MKYDFESLKDKMELEFKFNRRKDYVDRVEEQYQSNPVEEYYQQTKWLAPTAHQSNE